LASKNTNPPTSLANYFFPLTDSFYIFGQSFSDLASENTECELLASLASVLKNLSTPLLTVSLKHTLEFLDALSRCFRFRNLIAPNTTRQGIYSCFWQFFAVTFFFQQSC
jgi:hypothetical protein